ncbi:MAG: class I SAM-dependent methyltransferase [Cyanobacteria bacterium P01_H01_bin.74]
MYKSMAHVYDWSGSLAFSELVYKQITEIFEQQAIIPPAQVLDLACGTGSLTKLLAENGYSVTGIDSEPAMLALAEKKCAGLSPQPLFLPGDMQDFHLETQVDAVLCHYDSLNHLSNETELQATFTRVYEALKPGGFFLFDLNTLENYETFWTGKDTDEGPNYQLKTTASFNKETFKASVDFILLEYDETGQLTQQTDTLHEVYFNESAVKEYLKLAGFDFVQQSELQNPMALATEAALKTFWVCQKQQ